MLGAGKIYPVAEDEFVIDPFRLPDYWPRAYAVDPGWNRTAALWGAWDRENDIIYVYSEYYQSHQPVAVHAHAIKARGESLVGCIDPAGAGSSVVDGRSVINEFRKAGLRLFPANNKVTGVEGGIHNVYTRLTEGRLKIFRTCANLIKEMRIYRRNERGKVVKENDHLCDCLRYLSMSGMAHATKPRSPAEEDDDSDNNVVPLRGRNRHTGY
jgi:hypothetical protein